MSYENEAAAVDQLTLDEIAGDAPPQDQAEAEAPQIPTEELIYPVLSFACDLGAPNWGIGDAEKKALAESYAAVLDKYLPNVSGHFGVELNALLITAAIFAPRLGKPPRIEQDKKTEQAERVADRAEKATYNDGVLNVEQTLHGQAV